MIMITIIIIKLIIFRGLMKHASSIFFKNTVKTAACLFIFATSAPLFAYSPDCRIVFEGTVKTEKNGLVTTSNVKAVQLHKFNEYASCDEIASEALEQGSIKYKSQRTFTKRTRRLSPISRNYYFSPKKATWCLGTVTWYSTFNEGEFGCQTIYKD